MISLSLKKHKLSAPRSPIKLFEHKSLLFTLLIPALLHVLTPSSTCVRHHARLQKQQHSATASRRLNFGGTESVSLPYRELTLELGKALSTIKKEFRSRGTTNYLQAQTLNELLSSHEPLLWSFMVLSCIQLPSSGLRRINAQSYSGIGACAACHSFWLLPLTNSLLSWFPFTIPPVCILTDPGQRQPFLIWS